MAGNKELFTFNNQDYHFTIRLFNDLHDVYLNNTVWDDLFLEEDIFDWKIKGSIIIKSPYESFERESAEAMVVTRMTKDKLVYKFRNDGRDTMFISIIPSTDKSNTSVKEFNDKIWRIETEVVVYDVEDLPNDNSTHKCKKLYFWEKTYQMMTERDNDFSTANTGPHKGLSNISQKSNSTRSMSTGTSVGELLRSDPDFSKHAKLVDTNEWDRGGAKSKIFFSSPVGSKFIDNLDYLLNYTISSDADKNQPCIFKFERAEKTMTPKQFSLKSIKSYFLKAGNTIDTPKEYQNEHFFLYEHTTSSNADGGPALVLKKAPLNEKDFVSEFKADEYNSIRGYQLVDLSGLEYSKNLANYRVTAFNSTDGQFSEESIKHNAKEYKTFYKESIRPNIVTKNDEDRLALTPYIENNLNTRTVFSLRTDELARLANGRNRLIKYYLFANLAISFTVQGSTHRQPGRFFGLSKRTTNVYEHDHKLEGQYFVTNVIHHFSNTNRNYQTQLVGIKTHTYLEEKDTTFRSSDVMIIK